MTVPQPPENRNWRIIQELQRGLTEDEARRALTNLGSQSVESPVYAENDQHHYIEYHDGPLTIGRPMPDVRTS